MRAFAIALFILCIQVVSAMLQVQGFGLYENVGNGTVNTELIDSAQSHVLTKSYNTKNVEGEVEGRSEEKSGIDDFFTFAESVFNIKGTLNNLGTPEPFDLYISIPIYLIWLLAIVQVIRGWSAANSA